MAYETFARLLRLKLTLVRCLHQSEPSRHAKLRGAIRQIDLLLADCDDYPAYLAQFADLEQQIG
ncbi:MAG: hypothetical protein HY722_06165 [Planctomycetes bacterium]|nr:hypothetical protein [Planctomycetota bacterium]